MAEMEGEGGGMWGVWGWGWGGWCCGSLVGWELRLCAWKIQFLQHRPCASPAWDAQPSLGCSAQLNCNPGGERSNRSLLRVRGCCPKICPDCSVLVLGWWSSPSFSDVRMEEELLSVGVREG